MTPARAAQSLIEACADATVVQVDGGGHSLMSERPEEVLAALKSFAARVLPLEAK
jgi:pimeloyl-ACP methyl ester carboxylesterase